MRKSTLLAVFFGLFISSCHPDRIYNKNNDFENAVWQKEDIQTFEFRVEDISSLYDIHFNVRNSLSYPYANLYVELTLEDESGNELYRELKNFELFEPSGKPLGDGLGDLFDHQFLILDNFQFELSGTYFFKAEQFMRTESLPLIMSVGLMVEKEEV